MKKVDFGVDRAVVTIMTEITEEIDDQSRVRN